MQMTAEEQYALLKEDSLKKRAEMIERTIYESLESAKLFSEGQEKRGRTIRRFTVNRRSKSRSHICKTSWTSFTPKMFQI